MVIFHSYVSLPEGKYLVIVTFFDYFAGDDYLTNCKKKLKE